MEATSIRRGSLVVVTNPKSNYCGWIGSVWEVRPSTQFPAAIVLFDDKTMLQKFDMDWVEEVAIKVPDSGTSFHEAFQHAFSKEPACC